MKEIFESQQSFEELKAITDDVYAGKKPEYGRDVLALLEDYGIKVRQEDGSLHSVNISIPKAISDSIVVGLRYKKQDSTYTEDHFLFRAEHNLTAYYKGTFERVAPEYDGSHKDQIKEHEENVSAEKAAWVYMNRDLAKLNLIVDCYDKLFNKIEVNDNAYNQFFQLMLDSFSARLVTGLTRFFDKRNDSWSLSMLGVGDNDIQQIKAATQELITLRHKQVGHFAKGYESQSNFLFLTDKGIGIARNTIMQIHQLLSDIGRQNYGGHVYALTWSGVESSLEILLEHLEDGYFALNQLEPGERFGQREKRRKNDG